MAERRELGFPVKSTCNMKEQLLRTTLSIVRSQGHPYVELREDGKKSIFFCTLCLARCYGDSALYKHLEGKPHAEKLAFAHATLLKPNPWPFSDGEFFFHVDPKEQNKRLPAAESEQTNLLDTHHLGADSLSVAYYDENLPQNATGSASQDIEYHTDCDEMPCDINVNGDESCLVIPAVLQNDDVSDLVVRQIGIALVGARFSEKDGVSSRIRRIWCEWLGNKDFANEDIDMVPDHEFGVVTFAYNYNLGRKGLLEGCKYMLLPSPHSEPEENGSSRAKKRRSFSDPGDVSEALSNQSDSGEDTQSSNNSNSTMFLAASDDQLVHSRIISSKRMRKHLMEQQRIAAERMCDICRQKMLPDKDVGALLNRKTGKLVCSSRNITGSFHVFHVSCLLHWILLCEREIYEKQSVEPKVKRSRRRVKIKDGKNGKKRNMQEMGKQNYSVFCPECQGTGIEIRGEELEKPTVPLKEIFDRQIIRCHARDEWMKIPEELQNCSMGLTFPLNTDDAYQENVAYLKSLHFYRATSS